MDENKFLLIIDGDGLLQTQFHRHLPYEVKRERDEEVLEKLYELLPTTSDGLYKDAVCGVLDMLFDIQKNLKPAYMVVCWDDALNNFRKKLSNTYKANRRPKPFALKQQKNTLQNLLTILGIKQLKSDVYEADDLCGSIARTFSEDIPVRILTKDKDYFQLVSNTISLWYMTTSKKQYDNIADSTKQPSYLPGAVALLDYEGIKSLYGYSPEMTVPIKALAGDNSDNIKGCYGLGEKSAISLVQYYVTLDNMFTDLEQKDKDTIISYWKATGIKRGSLTYNALMADGAKDDILLANKLCTMRTDIKICSKKKSEVTLENFQTSFNETIYERLFEMMEFEK